MGGRAAPVTMGRTRPQADRHGWLNLRNSMSEI